MDMIDVNARPSPNTRTPDLRNARSTSTMRVQFNRDQFLKEANDIDQMYLSAIESKMEMLNQLRQYDVDTE